MSTFAILNMRTMAPVEVTMDNFRKETSLEAPWVQINHRKTRQFFGMCPSCNNAVQLVGMEVPADEGGTPHARHRLQKINGFNYSLERILSCQLFSGKARTDAQAFLKRETPQSLEILLFIREHFHVLVEIFREATGLVLSQNLARILLHDNLVNKRYRLPIMKKHNVAWLWPYVAGLHSIYGQKIAPHSPLAGSLVKEVDGAILTEKNQLVSNAGSHVSVFFAVALHQIEGDGENQSESIQFFVLDSSNRKSIFDESKTVYEERITIDSTLTAERIKLSQSKALAPYAAGIKRMAEVLIDDYMASGASRR